MIRVVVSAVLLAGAIAVEHWLTLPMWGTLLVYLVPYFVAGFGVLKEAAEGLVKGKLLDENFLMCIATIGALAMGFLPGGESEFAEAVFVMLFFRVGELFEEYAEGNSRRSIAHLMDLNPTVTHVVRNGLAVDVPPEAVAVDDTVEVRPGERVPVDGVILSGRTSLNTLALTGESVPRDVAEGSPVMSGCINLSGLIHIRATRLASQSTAARVLALVEDASNRKSRSEAFITRFARVYTPIVVALAALLAFVPPFFAESYAAAFSTWLLRALMFLVVSCPCALVISVPLTFFGGIGSASRKGILIKGSSTFDSLARLCTVVFDKTGTLTRGEFAVSSVHPHGCEASQLLHLAAHAESFSSHPIAVALCKACPELASCGCKVGDVEELPGMGVRARVEGRLVAVGNERLMTHEGVETDELDADAPTVVHVAVDGAYAGYVVIADVVKDDSAEAIRSLRAAGVDRTVMLTGDRRSVAEAVARRTGVDEVFAELLPADKVDRLESILRSQTGEAKVAFVGDGINDAPVLARADVGFAMGGLGSDAAIEAADVVIMDDKLPKVALAMRIARRTLGIARQNVVFAITVKVAILLLASVGLATMGLAVVGDVGVMVIAVLNAMRALK